MLFSNNSQTERLIDHLVIAGLLSGLISMLIHGHQLAASALLSPNDVVVMTPISKFIKVIEIFCILGAGLLSYRTASRFAVPAPARILMWLLFLWTLGHAVIAFKNGFSPAEPIGSKGPIVWWSLIFLFAGISKRRWKIIYPIIICLVFAGTIDMAMGVISLGGNFNRNLAVNTLRITLNLLLWTAPLVFLVPQKNLSRTILALIPLAFVGIGAIMTATRSWVVIFLFYSLMFLFRYLKTMTSPAKRVVTVYGILILFCIAFFSAYTIFNSQLLLSTNILSNRLETDSRSGQLRLFFERVPVSDLIVGTGPRGTWRMSNYGPYAHYGYVDGPYLLMLFVGGIPLLVSYIYLVVYPFLKAFTKRKSLDIDHIDHACITLGMVWALALTGFATYTFPTLYVSHYVILLCAGRCWGILQEAKSSCPLQPLITS